MNAPIRRFITCGMYAFTDNLRDAWQALFDGFLRNYPYNYAVEPSILFDTDYDLLRDPRMLLGHTCGYPLMRFLHSECHPVCVPLFDVEGCNGKYYSSRFVVSANSPISNLSQCWNHIAAVNGADSNSGMNVLRHAVSILNRQPPFFSKVITSGSHLNSLIAVANEEAAVAAIDCVSFALIKDEWPELTERVKTIGFSEVTCGLPLVIRFSERLKIKTKDITRTLNQALSELSDRHRKTLHLAGFEEASLNDYQGIIDLENMATGSGYPDLV